MDALRRLWFRRSTPPREPVADRPAGEPLAPLHVSLRDLKRRLGIVGHQEADWDKFAGFVLEQIEHLDAARRAARSASSGPSAGDRKLELTWQLIATPNLLMHAERELYLVLTPEQKQASGDALLTFHRQLLA